MGLWKTEMTHIEEILKKFTDRVKDVKSTYSMLTDEQFSYPDRKIYSGDWKFIGLKAKEDIPYPNLPISDLLDDPLIVIVEFANFALAIEPASSSFVIDPLGNVITVPAGNVMVSPFSPI